MGDSQNHSWFLDNLLNQKRFQKTTVDAQKKAALDETPAEHGVLEDLHRGADLSEGEGVVVALGGTVGGGLLRIGIVVESLNKSRPGLSHPWRLNGRTFPRFWCVPKPGRRAGVERRVGGKHQTELTFRRPSCFRIEKPAEVAT